MSYIKLALTPDEVNAIIHALGHEKEENEELGIGGISDLVSHLEANLMFPA